MVDRRMKGGKRRGKNRGGTGVLREYRQKKMKQEGARSCSVAWGLVPDLWNRI